MNKIGAVLLLSAFASAATAWSQELRLLRDEPAQIPRLNLQKLYHLEWETRPDNQTAKDNVVESQLGPFISRQVLVRSQTAPERSKNFGVGEAVRRAHRMAGLPERAMGSYQPVRMFPGRDRTNAVRAAVFRHLIDYRRVGYETDAEVQFLALGDVGCDPDPDLVAAIQAYPYVEEQKLTVVPVSRAITTIDHGILDRMTGEQGPIYRVDDILPLGNGNVRAVASFSRGDANFYTRIYELEQVDDVWRVISDQPFRIPSSQ